MQVVAFRDEHQNRVLDLILEIQRNEFGLDITAEDQPDLVQISTFYQEGDGNFWVALSGAEVVGTIALLDIGSSQAALRKMFVRQDRRGSQIGIASSLLKTLIDWSTSRSVREIFLGTTARFHAAHRFYEKNSFHEVNKSSLPPAFPIMEVDTKFYNRRLECKA